MRFPLFSDTIEKQDIHSNEIYDTSMDISLATPKKPLHKGITQRSEPLVLNDRDQRNPADRSGFLASSGNEMREPPTNNQNVANNAIKQDQSIIEEAAAKVVYPQNVSGINEPRLKIDTLLNDKLSTSAVSCLHLSSDNFLFLTNLDYNIYGIYGLHFPTRVFGS